MGIDYIEIRNPDLQLIGIIDTEISIIWHALYYGVGDFEIYAQATPEHISLLYKKNYVTRHDNDDVGIIERVNVTNLEQGGDVIIASGRFAKSLLERRLIFNLSGNTNTPTILRGNVEVNAHKIVNENAIDCKFDSKRNMPILELGKLNNFSEIIVDDNGRATEKQVSYQNLLTYGDEFLQEYGLSAKIALNEEKQKLEYEVFKGVNRSIDNTDGNEAVIFSKDYDNLDQSDYLTDDSTEKNVALIGGQGEGTERFYSLLGNSSGLARREMWVDSSSIVKTVSEEEIQKMFPDGTFGYIDFSVGEEVYAKLVIDNEKEYSAEDLEKAFPKGKAGVTSFTVGLIEYAKISDIANKKYKLTPIGYRQMLKVNEEKGNYTFTDEVYKSLLDANGKQELALNEITETFTGTINVNFGNWVLNRDYFLGDIVTIQDNRLNKYLNARIVEITEVQDQNGYIIDAKYE